MKFCALAFELRFPQHVYVTQTERCFPKNVKSYLKQQSNNLPEVNTRYRGGKGEEEEETGKKKE